MPKSTYSAHNSINAVYRGTAFTPPSSVYIALFTIMPGVGGGGTEVSGGSYARQLITFGSPSAGSSSNSIAATFPVASGVWGTVVGYAYYDSATSGNLLSFMNLSASRTVGTGDQVIFDVGQLVVSES